ASITSCSHPRPPTGLAPATSTATCAKATSRRTMCRSIARSMSELGRNCRYSAPASKEHRMRRGAFWIAASFLIAASLAMPAGAAAPADKLIYKIDSVIATMAHGRISIEAKGAVTSGGWKAVKLKLVRSPADPHTVVVDFVAQPPPANEAVIQGLLPVSAGMVVAARKGVVAVRAVSEANEMTSQILK